MSREVQETSSVEIGHPDDLLEVFKKGARSSKAYAIGIEFERIVVDPDTGQNLPFEGPHKSIEALLERFYEKTHWKRVLDQGRLISLTHEGHAITLEPGGQLEISASAHPCLKNSCQEILKLVKTFDEIASQMNVFYSRAGLPPVTTLEDAQWVPKSRYYFMRNFHKEDRAFLEMMALTASVQINFDFESEKDCGDKIRACSYLSPIFAALYANSFYEAGKANGFCTRRMQIWDQLAPNRSGVKPYFVDGTFSYQQYRDDMLNVPMYFVSRKGKYEDVGHRTFAQYLKDKPLGPVLLEDWLLHLTTTFPEVRLKNHLEFRSMDSNPLPMVMSAAAFLKGLLYVPDHLASVLDRFEGITAVQIKQSIQKVAQKGTHAELGECSIADHLQYLYDLALSGLDAQEQHYLLPIAPYIQDRTSPAQDKLNRLDFTKPDIWKDF